MSLFEEPEEESLASTVSASSKGVRIPTTSSWEAALC